MTKLETNEVQVSRNIKSCREKFGKTQEQVAVILGITKQTYLKIENNPMTCSINKLNDVSKDAGNGNVSGNWVNNKVACVQIGYDVNGYSILDVGTGW